MIPIKIEGATDTPSVYFDANEGIFEIKGKSFPEDVGVFYKPLLQWLDEYSRNPNDKTVVDLKLDYFNTASSKVILDIMYKLEGLVEAGKEVLIRWHFPDDDDDMGEVGEEYEEIVDVPFEHIPYKVQYK